MTTPLGQTYCWAGRKAFFSGRWNNIEPCTKVGFHTILTEDPNAVVPSFCEEHFQQLLAAGLVEQPYFGI